MEKIEHLLSIQLDHYNGKSIIENWEIKNEYDLTLEFYMKEHANIIRNDINNSIFKDYARMIKNMTNNNIYGRF